jgi:hypothetical protein
MERASWCLTDTNYCELLSAEVISSGTSSNSEQCVVFYLLSQNISFAFFRCKKRSQRTYVLNDVRNSVSTVEPYDHLKCCFILFFTNL